MFVWTQRVNDSWCMRWTTSSHTARSPRQLNQVTLQSQYIATMDNLFVRVMLIWKKLWYFDKLLVQQTIYMMKLRIQGCESLNLDIHFRNRLIYTCCSFKSKVKSLIMYGIFDKWSGTEIGSSSSNHHSDASFNHVKSCTTHHNLSPQLRLQLPFTWLDA
jgi:hypothetical protein